MDTNITLLHMIMTLPKFEKIFQELKSKGLKPTFKLTDNQATKPIKEFLAKENCTR